MVPSRKAPTPLLLPLLRIPALLPVPLAPPVTRPPLTLTPPVMVSMVCISSCAVLIEWNSDDGDGIIADDDVDAAADDDNDIDDVVDGALEPLILILMEDDGDSMGEGTFL